MAKKASPTAPKPTASRSLNDAWDRMARFYLDQWEEGAKMMGPAVEDLQKVWSGVLHSSLDLQGKLWDRLPVSEDLRQQARSFIEATNEAVMEAQRTYVRASGEATRQLSHSLRARLDDKPAKPDQTA